MLNLHRSTGVVPSLQLAGYLSATLLLAMGATSLIVSHGFAYCGYGQHVSHLLLLQVAVKVLDGEAVLRREAATGLCLEALVGEQLKHPNVVSTLAWAVVTGKVRCRASQFLA